jgi:thiol:disulfide interchange protein
MIMASVFQLNIAAFAEGNDDSSAAESNHQDAAWSTNFSASLDEAEKSNKLVLVDFYTDWCGWCKQLDKTTFADPAFMQYLTEHFIPVKLNAEDKGEGTRAAEQNDVTAYPIGIVFTPNGKALGRIMGYAEAGAYKKRLAKIAKKAPKKYRH